MLSSGSISENTPRILSLRHISSIPSIYPGASILGTIWNLSASYIAGARSEQSVAMTAPLPLNSFTKYCTTLSRVPALSIRMFSSIYPVLPYLCQIALNRISINCNLFFMSEYCSECLSDYAYVFCK